MRGGGECCQALVARGYRGGGSPNKQCQRVCTWAWHSCCTFNLGRRKRFLLFAQMAERDFHLSAAQKYCNNDIKCNLLQPPAQPYSSCFPRHAAFDHPATFDPLICMLPVATIVVVISVAATVHTHTLTLSQLCCRALWLSRRSGCSGAAV